MKTIERKYVNLTEGHWSWSASLVGPLSTGETVRLYRNGETADKAYEALELAVKEQNWEIV